MINNKNSIKPQEEIINIYILYYILPILNKIIKELGEPNKYCNINNLRFEKEKIIDGRGIYFEEIINLNNINKLINKYLEEGDKDLLFNNIEKAFDSLVKIKYEDRHRAELSYYLTCVYFHKHENEKTINYAKDAIIYAQKHGIDEIERAAKGYMAMSLLFKKHIESDEVSIIEPYILEAIDHYKRLKDNLTLSLLYSFLAYFYYSYNKNSLKSSDLYKNSYKYAKNAEAESIKKDIKSQVRLCILDSIKKKSHNDAGYMSCALAYMYEKDEDKKRALFYYNMALNHFSFANNIYDASEVREKMQELEQELSPIQRWMSKLGMYNLFE